jgi:predicted phage terminase large subunit-like protein
MTVDAVCKAKLLNDFGFFVRFFFKAQYGRRFSVAPHHRQIVTALERVANGECRRLIINIPPRYGKTEVAVKMFVAWCLANNSAAKFIHLSYSDDLALDNSSAIRDVVKSAEFQRVFPLVLRSDSDSKKKWFSSQGGGLYATAAGGAITGFGAGTMGRKREGTGSPADGFGGAIVIDDPLKPDDAFSETMRARINRRFTNTIASRCNAPETPIIVIMQRLHEDDMTGFLLGGGSGEEWEHLCIPAVNEDDTALWPEKHTREDLRRMELADAYTFAGQYGQRPSPLSGGIIKPDNIAVIDAIPHGVTEWVRGWDFASTTTGDWTAGAKLGLLPDGRLLIADMVRLRVGPDERDAALVNACARDGVDCGVSIPQDPGQAGVTQVKYLVRKLAGYSVHASPESGHKVVRAGPVAAQINVGNVVMLRGDWNASMVNEMRMFPNGSFDDQVDAVSRAYSRLIGSNPAEFFFPDDPMAMLTGAQRAVAAAMPGLPAGVVNIMAELPAGHVCGRCSSFDPAAGQCRARGFLVLPRDPGCDYFVPVSVG